MEFTDHRFRLSETFKNSSGKTSGSGFIGVLLGLVTAVCVLSLVVGWWLGVPGVIEVFEKVIQVGFLSACLLGVRKVSSVVGKDPKTPV
jgi:hypothetical protein